MRFRVFSRLSAKILLTAAMLLPTLAWAKKINIQWKAIPGALHYELQVEHDGKVMVKRSTLEETSWSGELAPGFYLYQIRAYDRIKRAGQWTNPLPLVVMPKPPETKIPADGKKIVQYSPKARTDIKWEAAVGATKYRLEVMRGLTVVHSEVYSGTSASLKELPAGKYTWQITAIVEPQGRVPASFQSRTWQSKPSDLREFRIEQEKLEAPVPVMPLGKIEPPSDRRLRFKWKTVEGAESYDLEVFAAPPKGRTVASNATPFAKVTTKENSVVVNLRGEGQYYWRVRALANVEEGVGAAAVGPQSTAEFKVDRNASYQDGGGYVALSTMAAPYSYMVVSPSTGTGSTGSVAITLRGSGEYYFHPQWGVGVGIENTVFQISNDSYNRKGLELVSKYRIKFGDSKFSWVFSPKLGIEERDYFEIFPTGGAAAAIASSVYGLEMGFDLRKQLSEKFSLGGKVAYFKPLMLSSDRANSLTGDASNRNISVGLQALYWLGGSWGLGAGTYIEKRSISYTLKTAAPTAAAEQVFMDGTYFFGSLIFIFGK